MPPTLTLRIVSVTRSRTYESVVSVTVPTKDGYITILAGHAPLVSALQPWVLAVRTQNNTETALAVGGGVIETDGTTVSVVADVVEDASEIDRDVVLARQKALREEIDTYRATHGTTDIERLVEMEESYLREIARMQVAEMGLLGK